MEIEVKTWEEADCSKAPEVEIGRSSEISNMFWEGKGAVQYYAKVSNTGMKGKGGKSFYEQGGQAYLP